METVKDKILTTQEIKDRLRITHPMQLHRALMSMREFGAFKVPGLGWRIKESDFVRYILHCMELQKRRP